MLRIDRLPLVVIAISLGVPALAQTTLDVGDVAPTLKSSRWLKGAPVAKFEKGRVYVVEFWATWCGPCKAAMPHLSELARKYRGKVDVIGVDAFEAAELRKVADFVKGQGAKMDYRVVADGPKDTTHLTWLRAAGEAGIPVTFVVGKDGRIAWIGNPEGLDAVLPKALNGTLVAAEEKAIRAAHRDPHSAVTIALGDGDYPKVAALVEAEVAKRPADAGFCILEMYRALSHFDLPRLKKRVRADLDRTGGDFGVYSWATLALAYAGLSPEAYRLGVEIAEESIAKSGPTLMMAARGAEMASLAGDWAKAAELQTAAIQAAETAPNVSPERLSELRKDLEKIKSHL